MPFAASVQASGRKKDYDFDSLPRDGTSFWLAESIDWDGNTCDRESFVTNVYNYARGANLIAVVNASEKTITNALAKEENEEVKTFEWDQLLLVSLRPMTSDEIHKREKLEQAKRDVA